MNKLANVQQINVTLALVASGRRDGSFFRQTLPLLNLTPLFWYLTLAYAALREPVSVPGVDLTRSGLSLLGALADLFLARLDHEIAMLGIGIRALAWAIV